MEKFTTLTAVAAPLPRDNIDTDIILPAEVISRLGTDMSRIGEGLFYGWRFTADHEPRPEFLLHLPAYKNAKILVTGANFGCGSSREHAVWTLLGFGFRCVIARSFGDIFYRNCFKKGLLPITLNQADWSVVMSATERAAGGASLRIDLQQCRIILPDTTVISFSLEANRRRALLEGLDEIGQTLIYEQDIDAFQQQDRQQRPWVYQACFHKPLIAE